MRRYGMPALNTVGGLIRLEVRVTNRTNSSDDDESIGGWQLSVTDPAGRIDAYKQGTSRYE
jgi:hypothetical protein